MRDAARLAALFIALAGSAGAAEVAVVKSSDVPAWRPAIDALKRGAASHTIVEYDLRNDRAAADGVVAALRGKQPIVVALGPLAAQLVRSELRGYGTHGLTRVASYVERLQTGETNPRPAMRHRDTAGGIVLDADGGMGHVAGPRAVELGLAALATTASVLVAVQSCGHLGALGIHALQAAEGGAFCIVGQRTPALLAMA